MESTFGKFLISLATQSPTLLVWLVGIVLGIVWYSRCPSASLAAVFSFGVLIAITVVGTATSGREGLALLTEHRPDVLVTGIQMPEGDIDGIELVRKGSEIVPTLRPVVLSVYDDTKHIDAALAAVIEDGSVIASIDPQRDAPELLRALLAEGIAVYECTPLTATLEDLFLEAVRR